MITCFVWHWLSYRSIKGLYQALEIAVKAFQHYADVTKFVTCCNVIGDEEARHRGTQKSVLERKAPPTFPLLIEMRERAMWVTHWVEDSVDCLLHGKAPVVQVSVVVRSCDNQHF